ncbi:unnamed protein product [Adineta steineri]|uniref:Uncharacterized protein n=1 Tax=Adineta steineri TaxID=433720 RepID=A0A820B5M8_9BILA|nr:unnamed protein product [Adineta steineri]CAF4187189.1 unnamed protein product [Adineta steineri]
MSKAENRDFYKFYGISELKHHFLTPVADGCGSNIIFKSELPQAVLKEDHSASSFMVLAKFGTGKTLLRCQYFETLQPNNYFKILILNKQINEYFERFVTETSTVGKNCKGKDCLEGWTKNEFAQLILSVLVTEFVDAFQKEQFVVPNISIEEKIQLIIIICFYYNDQGVSKLEYFVNSFFKKSNKSMYKTNEANVTIGEQNKRVEKPLLIQLKKDLMKFNILRKDYKKLELLLSVVENEEFQAEVAKKNMFDNIINDLIDFTLFMKNEMKKPVVFIIDGIDENQYFFQHNVINKRSLELFYRSSVAQEILSSVMAQNFYLSLFYPQLDGINIRDAIIRNDKFPIYTIEWNTRSLINYGDYLLQEMNKNASDTHCRPLPDFKTLINYHDTHIADMINEIKTPRALHYFMTALIREMNGCASESTEPFIATYRDVKMAFKNSNQYMSQRQTAD